MEGWKNKTEEEKEQKEQKEEQKEEDEGKMLPRAYRTVPCRIIPIPILIHIPISIPISYPYISIFIF
jgi:hypothetical protein